MRVALSDKTTEFAIPRLDHPYMVEFSACGTVRTRDKATINRLARLEKNRLVARLDGGTRPAMFVQVFSGGMVKNHLHVNVIVRPSNWIDESELTSLEKVQATLSRFTGKLANVSVEGKFFVSVSELSPDGLVRSAMAERKASGLAVKQTAQTLKFSDSGGLDELEWSLTSDGEYVVIGIAVDASVEIDSSYLSLCESLVTDAFDVLVPIERGNAATNG